MDDHLDLGCHDLLRGEDFLYRRILPAHLDGDRVTTAHCPTNQWKKGLSCDWSVLSAPDETATRKGHPLPAHILRIRVSECRDIGLDVSHCPVIDPNSPDCNLAHCLLIPPDPSKTAIALLREAFLKRARPIRVDHGILLPIRRMLRQFHPRRRAALRYVEMRIADARGS